jgi:hypothetical protein
MDIRHVKEIASIATELSTLHKEREGLNSKIATLEGQLRTLINQPNGNGVGTGRSPIPAFLDRNRTLMDRVLLLLDSDPDYEFTPEAVNEWLPGSNINSVRSALSRLAISNEIERLDKGLYRSSRRTRM